MISFLYNFPQGFLFEPVSNYSHQFGSNSCYTCGLNVKHTDTYKELLIARLHDLIHGWLTESQLKWDGLNMNFGGY